jgi:hypothetical protein
MTMKDEIIAWIGVLGCITLVGFICFEAGKEVGKEQARLSFECPKGTAYSVVYPDGSVKCQLPAVLEQAPRRERVWQQALRERMGKVK